MSNNTKTLTTTSTVDSLIGAFRAHVLGRTLPAPVVVTLYPSDREIVVQPEGALDTAGQLGNVLMWACTLSDVTADWSHTKDGRLHVSVHGRTSGGARMQVYGGGRFADCRGLVPLERGQSEGVSLDELYALVGLLREAQQQRGAA